MQLLGYIGHGGHGDVALFRQHGVDSIFLGDGQAVLFVQYVTYLVVVGIGEGG